MPRRLPRPVSWPSRRQMAFAREATGIQLEPTPLIERSVALAYKLEVWQPTGSFKVRGALSAIAAVPGTAHVVAASAGNHALGVAWAAERLGVRATVVIPETASPAKRAHLEELPVTLLQHGTSYDEAEAFALALAEDPAAIFVSAYNDPLVIAGQATVLDEIMTQLPERALHVIVPVGGGGLLAGIGLRARDLTTPEHPIRVTGVEAEASRALSASVDAGRVIEVPIGETIADGLAGNLEPGSVTAEIARTLEIQIVAVREEEIREAIRVLYKEDGVVAEGAGAVATAAVLAGHVAIEPGTTAVAIVSGQNLAQDRFATILAE